MSYETTRYGLHKLTSAALIVFLLVSAAPASAQSGGEITREQPPEHRQLLKSLLTTQVILHSVDMASTVYALHLDDRAREGNPLLAPMFQNPAALVAVSSAINALQVYTISKVHRRHPKLAVAWALVLLGTEAYAVTNNLRVASQLKQDRAGNR